MFKIMIALCLIITPALARDNGQWENSAPEIREWFKSLMQPDNPYVPCCGEADAYYADTIHVRDGKTYATITDDRDDAPLGRPPVPVGTVILIPDAKLKWDKGNPTGHGIVFIGNQGQVYCYVTPGGV